MPNFRSTLLRKIDQGAAICVRRCEQRQGLELAGGALLGGMAPEYWIGWLAVRPIARNRGFGSALVGEALRRFQPPCRVNLETFREDNIEGLPVRGSIPDSGFAPPSSLKQIGDPGNGLC